MVEVSTDTIALSGSTTIGFSVNTNDVALAGLQLIFTAPASGLTIEAVTSADSSISAFGPGLDQGVWQGTLAGALLPARPPGTLITVGSVTVRGLAPGTALELSAEFTPSVGDPINVGPTPVATVVPEPGTVALLGLGLTGLAMTGRRRAA